MHEDGNLQAARRGRQHVALGDEAEIDQDLAQFVAALALQFQRAVEILLGDLMTLNEDLAQPHQNEWNEIFKPLPLVAARCARISQQPTRAATKGSG